MAYNKGDEGHVKADGEQSLEAAVCQLRERYQEGVKERAWGDITLTLTLSGGCLEAAKVEKRTVDMVKKKRG